MRLFKDDRGIAMITAILATFVVTTIASAGFTLATHNLDQSGGDRRRTDSIHAAEAGIDAYLQYLSTAPITGTACWLPAGAGSPQTQTLTASPASSYVVSASYFTNTHSLTPMTCTNGALTGGTSPGAVLIHSVGTSAGVSRTMEAWYGLVAGGSMTPAFTGAVYSYSDATFSGGAAQFSSNTHQGDLYSETGNINLSGASLIDGAIEARGGTITLSGSAQGMKDVTSYGSLTTSGGVIIWGNGRSSNAGDSNGAIIKGTEYYCTTHTGVGLLGTTKDCNPNLPADRGGFPYFSYTDFQTNMSSLTEGSYTIHTYSDCTNPYNYIMSGPTGNQVVYISANCTLTFSKVAIPVNGNLAVISVGSLNLSGGSYWNPPNPTTGYHLRLEFNINSTAPSCTTKGIVFSGGSTTGTGIIAEIRTPCWADFSGGSFSGQGSVLAGNINFSGGSTINALPSQDPSHMVGAAGFAELFQYRREVAS